MRNFQPQFYHSEKLQSTKTCIFQHFIIFLFYHSEKLQSTKTNNIIIDIRQ